MGIEPEWGSGFNSSTFNNSDLITNGPTTGGSNGGNYSPDQLAGNLEQRMKLEPGQYMEMGWDTVLFRCWADCFGAF